MTQVSVGTPRTTDLNVSVPIPLCIISPLKRLWFDETFVHDAFAHRHDFDDFASRK